MKKNQKNTNPNSETILPKKINFNLKKLIIVIFPILLYAQTFSFDYALDDVLMITSNEFTKKGVSGIKEIFTNDVFVGLFGDSKNLVAGGRYRPLSHAMFAIEYELFGQNPAVGHLFNILFYAILSLVVYKTLNLMLKEQSKEKIWFKHIPFITTLLFIAHPLHSEVVANIKGRDEIISMLGSFGTLYFSFKFIENKKLENLFFSFLCITTALFSKENSITFLGIIPLSLYFFSNAKGKEFIYTIIPILAGSVIFIFARIKALGFIMQTNIDSEILNNPYVYSTKLEEIATTIYTWLIYLKLMIFPHPLTHDYYPWHLEIMNFSNPKVWLALAIILAIFFVAIKKLHQKQIISYGILFFVFTFSIQSNLIFNIGTFMNERFVFVALLGFCLIVAYFISQIKFLKDNNIKFFIILVLIIYSAKTISRTAAWKNNYTLFTTDVKTSKNSAKVNVSVAEVLINKAINETNQAKKEKLLNQSLVYLNHAKKIHPNYFGVYDLSGLAYYYLENYEESFKNYKTCIKLAPNNPKPKNNLFILGQLALNNNKTIDAIKINKWLTESFPDSVNYKFNLALAFENSNNIDESLILLQNIIETDSNNYKALAKLGEIYGKHKQNIKQAEIYLLKSISINPNNLNALENLGIVYGIMNNFEKSVEFFNKALAIDSSIPRLHLNIANSYFLLKNMKKFEFHKNKAQSLEKKL